MKGPCGCLLVVGMLSAPALAGTGESPPVIPTVARAVSVVVSGLPTRKAGLRDLQYGLGKEDPATVVTTNVGQGLRELHAFSEQVSTEQDYQLVISLTHVKQELNDLRDLGAQARASTVSLEVDADVTWRLGEAEIRSSHVKAVATRKIPEGSIKGVLREAWDEVLGRLGRTAFVEALQAGAFGPPPKDSPWLAPEGGGS